MLFIYHSFIVISFITCTIFSTQAKRVIDQMYVSFDRARYCVRRLNATHEIGCQSGIRGNTGRMYMIDNEREFDIYLNNEEFLASTNAFILVLSANLFDSNHLDRLTARLDSKLHGLLVYLKTNSSRPGDFSTDDQCPNHRSNYYLNQTQIINWNRPGSGLFFRSFPFPMMFIDEEDDYQQLLRFYRQFNTSRSSPVCGLELKSFQNAAHSSQTCLRRNDISHSLIDLQEIFCDPIGGLNIYSKLPGLIADLRPRRSVILILAPTDSFQMFLKSKGSTGGVQQPAIALITFLALAHLIGQEQEALKSQEKEIRFVTLDGDALDYSASFRFMFDMINGYFPAGNKAEQRILIEHIHSIIEFQGLSITDNVWIHTSPSTLVNRTFVNTFIQNNPMMKSAASHTPLPPASSQIFLRESSSTSFPAYVFTSTDENQFFNHYYHSFLDDPSTVSIDLSTLDYSTTTDLSRWIKRFVEPFAKTLLDSLGIKKSSVVIKQEIVNNLIYCILKNINCPLIYNVTNQSIGNTFQPFDQTSMPFSINTYPLSTSPTFPFIQYVLSYFLRDRSFDRENFTDITCREQARNDTFHSYIYVNGYPPSIDGDRSFPGYCIRSYIRSVSSISPAFVMENYNISQMSYPMWTESRWSTVSLRIFIMPSHRHEIMTLIIGLGLFLISFTLLFYLRYYTKISLFQPSSS